MNTFDLENERGLLTRAQLAKRLRVSQPTVKGLTDQGMPHIRIGRQFRYDYGEVLKWLKAKSIGT
ncbi:helix-turn-helix domain-containing protein [Rubinisphaera margarita]|uniref:helix-turn-helix domain-containing protein n=1 Tax=Rubinisphaera margarita TaxID=2909586 RepID=UPI0036F29B3F